MALTKDSKVALEASFFSQKCANIAKSGYGKSYTARVIAEEGRELGVPIIIVDPQDAYLNMDGFDYVDARNVKSAKAFGQLLAQTGRSTIIRTKRLTIDEQNKFLAAFLVAYKRAIRKGIQYMIVDEAHKFAPEGEKTAAKEHLRGMFQENRSDGLGIMAVTQRPARLDKTILAQADILLLGRVTAYTDKRALLNYLDEKEDLDKLPKLKKGEFFIVGIQDEAFVSQIREARSEHSGTSPKNLLNEDVKGYDKHIRGIVAGRAKTTDRGATNMSDTVTTQGEIVQNILPGKEGMKDLVVLGAKVGLGGATAGFAGTLIGSRVASPIPVVSSRTLGAGATTVAMYMGYRFVPDRMDFLKDTLKYGAAGGAAFTAGSLLFDALAAAKFQPPRILQFLLSTATGASPVAVEKSASGAEPDLNTKFA